jgi:hypothetical protein
MATNNAIDAPLPISFTNGGTGAALTASNGGILYSGASAAAILAGTATANQVLLSGSSTTPAWSTATYPATTTINQILYSSSANTIGGITTGNSGALITSAGGIPSISSTLPAAVQGNITSVGTISSGTWQGSVIGGTYGGTGVNNGASTITIGGNLTFSGAFTTTITVTAGTTVTLPTSGTLATTAQTIATVDQTSSSATLAVNTLYVTDNGASLVTYTLPTTSAVGARIVIVGSSSGLWKIVYTTGQSIKVGSSASTATTGNIAATLASDCVELVCTVANTTWTTSAIVGNITVV